MFGSFMDPFNCSWALDKSDCTRLSLRNNEVHDSKRPRVNTSLFSLLVFIACTTILLPFSWLI